MKDNVCKTCGSKKISLIKGGSKRCSRCGTYIVDKRPEWSK